MSFILLILMSFSYAQDNSITVNMFEGEVEGQPKRFASWCNPPKVTVCKGSGITKHEVAEAYEFLEHEVSSISNGKCECSVRPGEIQFGIECFEDNAPGTTFLSFGTGEQCMTGSIVEINYNTSLVIVHEAAHSIGWMHSSEVGHLMFPVYRYAGWTVTGMR
jgi:hypothetical protein